MFQSELQVSDSSSQSKAESDSLEKIKIKSFAEIMAQKRQRILQQQQKPTNSSVSAPVTMSDMPEKTSLDAAANTAKKGMDIYIYKFSYLFSQNKLVFRNAYSQKLHD